MKKNNYFIIEQQEEKYIFMHICIVALVAMLIAVTIFDFKAKLNNYIGEEAYSDLQEISEKLVDIMKYELQEKESIITTFVKYVEEHTNISDRKAFIQAKETKKIQMWRDVDINADNIQYYVPILENGEIISYVYIIHNVSLESNEYMKKLNYSEILGYIIDTNGNVIVDISETGDKNVFVTMKDDDVKQIKNNMISKESNKICANIEGKSKYLTFEEVGIYDWYVLTELSEESISEDIGYMNNIMMSLMFRVVIIFILIGIYGVVMIRKEHQKTYISNLRNEVLISNITGGIKVSISAHGGKYITFLSEGFIGLIGYDIEQLNEMFDGDYSKIIYNNDLEMVLKAYENNKDNTQSEYKIEYRVVKKDGTIIWVLEC